MKKITLVTASIIAIVLTNTTIPASAASRNDAAQQPLMLAAAQSHRGEGIVTKIDKKGKKVELKHGPIKSLGWMGMKMFFEVDNEDLLEDVQVDDKVSFEFIETRDKRFVVTDIEVE